TAEETGYEAVFVPEIDGREAFSVLTGFAGVTSRVSLGTGVVTVWTRHPATAAMAAGTVHDVSGGRMILGIGAGSPTGPGAGRDPGSVTVAVYVRACLGVEDDVALPPLRAMTGLYASIPHYRKQLEAVGLGQDAAIAAKAVGDGRPQDVPEHLVRALTVLGG